RQYSAGEIPSADLERIVTLCGTSNIEEIYDVTGMQEMMIRRMRKIKDSYVLQFMIRTKLKLDSIAFREQVDKVCVNLDNLRSVYIYRHISRPYRVVMKNRTADVNFFDLTDQLCSASPEKVDSKLEELMEADRRNGFDLERDSLLRILIYKLDEDDTYAILISQPHVNSDGISVSMLFRNIFIGYGLKQSTGVDLPITQSTFREYAEYLKSVDKEKELAWWREYLAGFGGEIFLPGYSPSNLDYELNLYFQPFGEETVKALKELQKSCKSTFATIIQTVWAILLSRLTGTEDVVFGSVTAGRDSAVANSMQISGGFINTLLLRSALKPETPFVEAVQALQKDYQSAMEFSHCSPEEIRGILGRESALTNHILNFHNYNRNKAGAPPAQSALPGLEILGMNVYDNLSYDLALYFRENDEGQYGCTFAYNARTYSRESILLIGDYFRQYLDLTAEHGGMLTVDDYPAPDLMLFELAQQAITMVRYKKAAFLKSISVFQGVDDDTLMRLTENALIRSFMQNDQVFGRDDGKDVICLVMDGFIDLSLTAADGWNRKFSFESRGHMLPLSGVGRGEAQTVATVSSATATLMEIPLDDLKQLLGEYPEVAIRTIRILENKWLNYGRLWASAE
ncbi:MAG: hypothetical protein K6C12_15560, partial [Oscillospiraceae bacterium]|nr:hypothetical protein [Oscillospiraceae bacterium]